MKFMKFKLLIIALLFISCKEIDSSKAKDTPVNKIYTEAQNDTLPNKDLTNVIDFDFSHFNKIDNYKNIDFESDLMTFDRLLMKDTTIENCYCSANKEQYPVTENTFFINTDYGKINFKSVNDGDLFYQYSVINNTILKDYVVISVSTIDGSYTVFLNKRKYEGFRMNGEVCFFNDMNYFVSLSNTADYCLLEFYKINNAKITNIVNLYSREFFVDCVKWDVDKLYLTVAYSNKNEYFKISWSALLKTFLN